MESGAEAERSQGGLAVEQPSARVDALRQTIDLGLDPLRGDVPADPKVDLATGQARLYSNTRSVTATHEGEG